LFDSDGMTRVLIVIPHPVLTSTSTSAADQVGEGEQYG
jgi:hypothetical protein